MDRVASIPIQLEKRYRHTQGRRFYEDRGRDWSDVCTGQRMLSIAENHKKLGKGQATNFL